MNLKNAAICFGLLTLASSALAQGPRLQIGSPVIMGQTIVIPILSAQQDNPYDFNTLGEAAKAGTVVIRDRMHVAEVTNNSKVPLLLMAGDLLIGGHQDQIIQEDYTVMPGKTVEALILCVEPRRATPGEQLFKAGDFLVPDWIRSIGLSAPSGPVGLMNTQMAVWDEVAKVNRARQTNSPTGALWASLGDTAFLENVGGATAKLQTVDDSAGVVGMIVALGGRILSADIFGSHKIFDHARPNLLKMYAAEDELVYSDPNAPQLTPEKCMSFLRDISLSSRLGVARTDAGEWYRLGSRSVLGMEISTPGSSGSQGFIHGAYFPS